MCVEETGQGSRDELTGKIAKECQSDIDEEVDTTATDDEDANGWHFKQTLSADARMQAATKASKISKNLLKMVTKMRRTSEHMEAIASVDVGVNV